MPVHHLRSGRRDLPGMLLSVTLGSRLRSLDDRVLRGVPDARREAWGRQHGWWMLVLLGVVLMAFSAWGFATDRPAMAVMPGGFGLGWLLFGVILFTK